MKHPPRWAERLVQRWSTGSAAGPSVAGDLWEEWRRVLDEDGARSADRWYVRQAIRVSLRYALGRTLDGLVATPGALARDVRAALRGLRRSPGFALVATLSLGGALGLTTAVFALINGLLFAPLPWPDAERLVDVDMQHPREVCAGCSVGASYPAFSEWRERGVGLESLGAMEGFSVLLVGPSGATRVQATAISPEVPELLGADMAIGRTFTADEHRAGGRRVVVLSHALWQRELAGDQAVLGSGLTVDGVMHEVVGILSDETRLLDRGELWLPIESRHDPGDGLAEQGLWVFGRLRPEAEPSRVAETLTALHSGLASEDPTVDSEWSARVVPMRVGLVDEVGQTDMAWLVLGAAGSVLLIACLNLASLLLARVTERAQELSVRGALGASTVRLARLVLVEAALVAGIGAGVGMVVTVWARSALMASLGGVLPPWATFPIDTRVWTAGVGGATAAALFCGLAPALRAARRRDRAMLQGTTSTDGASVLRRHRFLLGAQVALGVGLVASTALAIQSFERVSDFDDLGYRWDEVLGVRVVADAQRYPTAFERATLHAGVLEAFGAHPAVTETAAEAQLFIGSWGAADGGSPMHIVGRPEPVPDRIVPRHSLAVSPGYFDLFDLPVERGRPITASDGPGAPPVAVVNREAARLLWPDSDPLGARFTLDNGTVAGGITVVGVVSDVVINPMSESRRVGARIYFSLDQSEATEVVYRLGYDGQAPSRTEIAERLAEVDPFLPIESVTTVRQELRRWIMPVIVSAGVLGTLGGLALVLLALGVFGTLSYQVAARAREIGIRRALGAGAPRLAREMARDVLRVVAVGLAGGSLLAALAGTALRSSFVQIGTSDPLLLAASALAVLLAAGLAASPPSRPDDRSDRYTQGRMIG